jgi:Tfp pilus assembly protein PilF
MACPCKREVLVVAGLLVCVLLLVGCNGRGVKSSEGGIGVASSTDKKSRLINELDRKFENPDVHFELGQLYRGEGLWTQAEYHYETALRFDPANRAAQAALVRVLTDSGEKAEANALARRYIEQVGGLWKETLKLGNAFRKEQVDDYVLVCYRQALRLSPESAEVHREMGYYYLSKNEKDAAKEHFKESFRLDPRQADVAGELGRLGVAVRMPPGE